MVNPALTAEIPAKPKNNFVIFFTGSYPKDAKNVFHMPIFYTLTALVQALSDRGKAHFTTF